MMGEESQKAMTAGSGTPMASRAAIKGITPQEQKGESAPISAAAGIMKTSRPLKAFAISRSEPEALA